jgi:hypothetical protein
LTNRLWLIAQQGFGWASPLSFLKCGHPFR